MHRRPLRILLPLIALLAAALGLAACGGSGGSGTTATRASATLPGARRPPVTLGTGSVTEQLVLGQLYQQALQAKGFRVALKQNVESPRVADAALRSGQIDLYPQYVGTFDAAVAHATTRWPGARAAFAAALVVLPDYARAHRLASVADLASIGRLRLGAAPDFRTRPAGLPGLARTYGVRDVDFAPLTVGLQYQALDDGQIDVAAVATTDGQLQSGRYVLLRDPRHLFGFQNVAPVVARRVLRAEGPAFAATLDAVSRALTTGAMQRMNAAVAIDGRSPADVARQFLQASGLV